MAARVVAAALLLCLRGWAQIPESTRTLVDYDRSLALHLKQAEKEGTAQARVFEIEYDSPRGGRVPGYLVAPRSSGRFAGIVFGHWGQGTATEFLAEAIRYARAGAVCILIDDPWVRPEPSRRLLYTAQTTALQDRDALAQAIVDLRRAFDILLMRNDVDPKRIAYIGHSFGAQFGAILTAVDRRMATSVLITGVPSEGALWFDSNDPAEVELRKTAGLEALHKLLDVTGVFDGIRFVPYAAPIPLLFQFARYDHFPVASMERYAEAASQPKRVLWYPTGHELNDPQAIVDRARWLEQRIGLKGAVRAVSAGIR